MTLPKSKILRTGDTTYTGMKLNKDVHKTNQIQNVNVIVERSAPVTEPKTETPPLYPEVLPVADNPYNVPITPDVTLLHQIIKDREDFIKGLQLIIKISKENPLIINKLIIAKIEDLTELIRLLTNAQDVEIRIDTEDINCCSFGPQDYYKIHHIAITVNGQVYDLHHTCFDVINCIEDSGISLKIVRYNN